MPRDRFNTSYQRALALKIRASENERVSLARSFNGASGKGSRELVCAKKSRRGEKRTIDARITHTAGASYTYSVCRRVYTCIAGRAARRG